jgi:NitT/TauT family transport system ATP-binding protein
LFPWRTVLENVVLPAEIRGADAIEARRKAHSLLNELGLAGFEDGYPSQLSGGMLQRAALARALLTNPGILLLDEPFSALDETTREQIWTDFNQFWREHGLTVVLVTHSIREAAFLSDRVITLSPRPARVVSDIRIPLGSERAHRITLTSEFTSICEAIRNAVPMS